MVDLPLLSDGGAPAWLDTLGLAAADTQVLRLDLTSGGTHLGTEVVVDGGQAGCWRGEGTDVLRLRPTSTPTLLRRLLAWQRVLADAPGLP